MLTLAYCVVNLCYSMNLSWSIHFSFNNLYYCWFPGLLSRRSNHWRGRNNILNKLITRNHLYLHWIQKPPSQSADRHQTVKTLLGASRKEPVRGRAGCVTTSIKYWRQIRSPALQLVLSREKIWASRSFQRLVMGMEWWLGKNEVRERERTAVGLSTKEVFVRATT